MTLRTGLILAGQRPCLSSVLSPEALSPVPGCVWGGHRGCAQSGAPPAPELGGAASSAPSCSWAILVLSGRTSFEPEQTCAKPACPVPSEAGSRSGSVGWGSWKKPQTRQSREWEGVPSWSKSHSACHRAALPAEALGDGPFCLLATLLPPSPPPRVPLRRTVAVGFSAHPQSRGTAS